MKSLWYALPLLCGLAIATGLTVVTATIANPAEQAPQASAQPPTEWIEPATGHRVIRLSREPGTASFYFHQNAYTAKGDKLVVSTRGGLATINLTTLGDKEAKIEPIVEGSARSAIVGKNTRQVFYVRGGSIYTTHVDTKATREVVKLPPGYSGASGLAVNADETLLASSGTDPKARELAKPKSKDEAKPSPQPPGKGFGRAPGGRSMVLFTVNIQTGDLQRLHYATDWLNHTQCSPTDPNVILFCHEGTWQLVDRIWTIRTDGTGRRLMHPRAMDMEIAGHEFFGSDGKMIWYDLQTPRSKVFWLAGVNIATGERIRYPVQREHWSVHFNQSPDGKRFAGDGGGPNSVANRSPDSQPLPSPGNGQWIYLFTPTTEPFEMLKVGNAEVRVGKLEVERLVDLSKHDYRLEPNVSFTPNGKWIVFRSNMHGPTHVYAVEVAKAK